MLPSEQVLSSHISLYLTVVLQGPPAENLGHVIDCQFRVLPSTPLSSPNTSDRPLSLPPHLASQPVAKAIKSKG